MATHRSEAECRVKRSGISAVCVFKCLRKNNFNCINLCKISICNKYSEGFLIFHFSIFSEASNRTGDTKPFILSDAYISSYT